MKNITRIIAAVIFASALVACEQAPHPQAQYAPQQYQSAPAQPVQAPQVVQHDSGIGTGTALVGAAAVGTAAYMLGKANAEKAAAAAPANKVTTTISQPAAPRPVVQPPVAAPKTVMAAPAPAAQVFKPQAAKNMATVTAPKTGISMSKRR